MSIFNLFSFYKWKNTMDRYSGYFGAGMNRCHGDDNIIDITDLLQYSRYDIRISVQKFSCHGNRLGYEFKGNYRLFSAINRFIYNYNIC